MGSSEDTEAQRDAAAVEATDTVDSMEENKKHPYYSLSMSRNSCCTLEIEDWGNLKNDQTWSSTNSPPQGMLPAQSLRKMHIAGE